MEIDKIKTTLINAYCILFSRDSAAAQLKLGIRTLYNFCSFRRNDYDLALIRETIDELDELVTDLITLQDRLEKRYEEKTRQEKSTEEEGC